MYGLDGLDWIGLDWIGLDWIGLDWIGLDWIGLDWIGLDWIGLDVWVGVFWFWLTRVGRTGGAEGGLVDGLMVDGEWLPLLLWYVCKVKRWEITYLSSLLLRPSLFAGTVRRVRYPDVPGGFQCSVKWKAGGKANIGDDLSVDLW
ncbi:hypothetical protein B0J18DRAFT_247473 [Chaetomium sp. MPI-SDFR-AT-0129]|nr:hypothetical protein B0J18DRAFT_247473 [Chaetomium sp. MPI-SDFR-AT-0129]